MTYQIERPETNLVRLVFEVPAEELEEAVNEVYKEQGKNYKVTGFREGEAPRRIIEETYGENVFLEGALYALMTKAYGDALRETGLRIVSRPKTECIQLESEKPFLFAVTFAVRPEVKLGPYKGLEVRGDAAAVTEEEVGEELRRELESKAVMRQVFDRPAKNGDQVSLDFEGYADGVPFAGGKAEHYPVVIGSGALIPGFEEQLAGMNIGETKEIKIIFPKNYTSDLAGREAVFRCRLNSISFAEVPKLTDEYAKQAGYSSAEEYREAVRRRLRECREKSDRMNMKYELAELAAKNAEIDIPEQMIREEQLRRLEEYKNLLRRQGISWEEQFASAGWTDEILMKRMRSVSEMSVRINLVLEEIAEAEHFEVSPEEFEAELKRAADEVGTDFDRLTEEIVSSVRDDILRRKALDFLSETSVQRKPISSEG